MKNLMIFGVFLFLLGVNAGASMIILNNGETIKGNIVQQDKDKVVVEVDGNNMTFYKDEIKSINKNAGNGSETQKDNESANDQENNADKDMDNGTTAGDEDTVLDQYMNVVPTEPIIIKMIQSSLPTELDSMFIEYLKENGEMDRITSLRRDGLKKYFSEDSLKAAVNFYSSSAGSDFQESADKYDDTVVHAMRQIAKDDVRAYLNNLYYDYVAEHADTDAQNQKDPN